MRGWSGVEMIESGGRLFGMGDGRGRISGYIP